MPSQHMGTFLTQAELKMIEQTTEKLGISRYRLFKEALKEYCERHLKEEVENDRGKGEDKSERGTDSEENNRAREENRLTNDIFG